MKNCFISVVWKSTETQCRTTISYKILKIMNVMESHFFSRISLVKYFSEKQLSSYLIAGIVWILTTIR